MGRKGSPRSPQSEGGSRASSPSSPLWALPEELLLLICSYLDAQALGRLGQVCRRLCFLSSRDLLWRRIARGCLNSGFTQLGTDLAPGIPVKERVKVSQNWSHGRCQRETVLKWKCNLMPWIELDGEYLYLSQAENIQAYRLCPDGTGLQRHPQAIFSGHQEDVCRFVLVNSHIVSGGGDGNIVLHKIHGSYSIKFSAHEQEVNCVDFQGGLIVSGSRDRTAKVWSLSAGRVGQCLHTVQTEDRVWSIAISPLLSSFVTGTACCGHTSPLRIWDLERMAGGGDLCAWRGRKVPELRDAHPCFSHGGAEDPSAPAKPHSSCFQCSDCKCFNISTCIQRTVVAVASVTGGD
ncbi:F-box/WD repeat-containing protein 4 isoform X4 [Pezoporus flaviventris]|uniref:F-box/WD repeat-containing protein 4 isoform X4 n=1 Tax=Pezoporus flaviventris TaxID=889875 RepID=UPI002AAF330D|nr:F-box/WD repeat-containing protein 4 isoform X4 [Pezoporus flaviventris]